MCYFTGKPRPSHNLLGRYITLKVHICITYSHNKSFHDYFPIFGVMGMVLEPILAAVINSRFTIV